MSLDRANLLDLAKELDPNGSPAMIAEVLNETNPIVQDAPVYPSNAMMGNRVTLRSSLPTVPWGKLNKGAIRSKSSVRQQVDAIGYLHGLSEVDARHRKILGEAAFNRHRWLEDKTFIESMNQTVASTILYGDEKTNPLGFTGLAPRLATLNPDTITDSRVRSMGTVTGGDGTSIYVIDWSEDTCHLTYPMNSSTVGLEVEDLGKQRVDDVDGNPFTAYVTEFHWMVGLTVKNPRHIARLANIDVSDANVASPTQGTLIYAMIDLLVGMPQQKGTRVAYTDRRIVGALMKQAKTNAEVSIAEWQGQQTPHILGIPVRALDQISIAESTVS